jgi:site-specific recombinase
MAGEEDRRDRKEATRLLVAAALALIVLVAMVVAGLYYFTGAETDSFSEGLGLKNAALISFAVSFVAILVMTVVSGGDAILGELPFTIAGFLIFFVIFWLMIAWIF